MKTYIICSIGLTAAGKTTILRKIANICDIKFVSEGSIKRDMVIGEYSIKNSIDEELRSKGYKTAISIAFDYIQNEQKSVIIDASFHQQFRRNWIYDEIKKRDFRNLSVIWVYCVCDNEEIIQQRIYERFVSTEKCADNQANTIGVYNYTKSTFDDVLLENFEKNIPTHLVVFDSEKNKIRSCIANNKEETFMNIQIENWRNLWESYM